MHNQRQTSSDEAEGESEFLLTPSTNDETVNVSPPSTSITREFDKFLCALKGLALIDILFAICVFRVRQSFCVVVVMCICLLSWRYCSQTVHWIMHTPCGEAKMQTIAEYIREGSDSYLRTQYKVIAWMALLTATGLAVIYMFRGSHSDAVSATALSLVTAFSFLFGAFCSALAGYTGVWTSVRCNLRVAAAAARYDYFNCFLLCFRAGAVSAILSASMCVLGLTSLYIACSVIFYGLDTAAIPLLLGACTAWLRLRLRLSVCFTSYFECKLCVFRRLRFRRFVRGAVYAARRRHLHESRRCGRGHVRQNRKGHSRG